MHLSSGGPSLSHLLFANDVLLICKVRIAQVRLVMNALNDFYTALGLKVDLEKSRVNVLF